MHRADVHGETEPNMYARRKGMLNELAGKIKTPLLKATEKGA